MLLRGPRGPQGFPEPMGPQGPQGEIGPVGPQGPTINIYGTIYNNTTSNVTIDTPDTYVPISLNTTGPASETSVAPNQITITTSGTYAIYYRLLNVTVEDTDNKTLSAAVFNNDTIITPTTATVAMSETSAGNFTATLSAETIVELTEGDVLTLQVTSNTPNTLTIGNLTNVILSVKGL